MDFLFFNDLFLECLRAVVLIALLLILFLRGRGTSLGRQPGWNFILVGFCLITMATALDITDEIPGLEKFIIIGDTGFEAFLEKVPGYLLGFTLLLVGFYKMIPALQLAEQSVRALHESEERFRKIFAASPDPVLLSSHETGRIIDVNPGFVRQSGLSRDDVLGKNITDLQLWTNPGKWDDFKQQLDGPGLVENFEIAVNFKSDRSSSCLVSGQIVTIGGNAYTLTVIHDITSIKEAERALREIDRIKTDFISTAAHELRTPLTSLIGYAELLSSAESSGGLSEREREQFLETIREKGFVLSQIVDDLLDLSRIDAGLKFVLQLETINPERLLSGTVDQFRLHFPDHGYELFLANDSSLAVDCDPKRIMQVLENLLTNAIKYSPPGSLVTIASRSHDEVYEFSVTDRGIGMSPDQVDKAFDMFYRVDASNTATGGLGLGLSIVKQIVDLHGGSVSIESQLGRGTCFRVELPKTAG